MVANFSKKRKHLFHIVTTSPWPIATAFAAFMTTTGGVMYMHFYRFGGFLLTLGVVTVLFSLILWWRDVIRESTFEGMHTTFVQRGLRMGMILFIISELMFFFAFFWAFFHTSLVPNMEIGNVYPPMGMRAYQPDMYIAMSNTLFLLLSSWTATLAHHFLIMGPHQRPVTKDPSRFYSMTRMVTIPLNVNVCFLMTLFCAVLFILLQGYEYYVNPFSINSGTYGSVLYVVTGFHGLHVIIGAIFLAVCYCRYQLGHFTQIHHIGLEAAVWYWHFVDVVWLYLFIFVYFLPSGVVL